MPSIPLRLRSALVLAAVGHVLLAASLFAVPPRAPHPIREAQEISVVVDVETPVLDPQPRDDVPARKGAVRIAEANAKIAGVAAPRATEASKPDEADTAPTHAPESSWTFDPLRRTASDLGIGSHWKTVAATAEPTTSGSARETPHDDAQRGARAVERSIRAELAARDLDLGLGRAGPLVSAAHEAASSSNAPETGTTIFEVETDAAGAVTVARADDRAWNAAAATIVRTMSGKTLRVPRGARGLRVRLRVVAERALPSGGRGTSSLGAVPDDAPGGGGACVGKGLGRRCAAGMPAGVTNAQHDASDIGAKPTRIVHVRLLSEAEL